ncbi:MAG: selenide, water dikinase SelD [Hyphomicrobiaceae bacterium]
MIVTPPFKHIVLVGGGHSHVTVIREFGLRPEPGVVMTVVAKEIEAPYSGMLPGYVAGHYGYDDVHIDIIRLATWAGCRVIQGEVTGVDRVNQHVEIAGRAALGYDLLSIDIGITPRIDEISGAREYALAVKPVSAFAAKWQALEQRALKPEGPRSFAVVGAGAAGFELVLAMRHRLRSTAGKHGLDGDQFSFSLVGAGPLLPTHNGMARRLAYRELQRQNVKLVENQRVVAMDAVGVKLDDGKTISADATLLATNARPATWFKTSNLPVDERGFLAVRPTLQVLDDDDVFAVGDCATVLEHRREKAGVFAVRQGPPLTENLRLRAQDKHAQPFVPQKTFLTLLSTGGANAIAARNGVAVSGRWVWRWKDRIDRKFMAMFHDLSAMQNVTMPESEDMRCAGCAAKVGPVTLATALDRTGNGNVARDDAAMFEQVDGTTRLETIDFFRAFWPEPYLFGEIAAVHATSDIFAMGGNPTHALANIVLTHATPRRIEEDLVQLLAGARAALAKDGVVISGGHTSEGAELAAGFFVSGEAKRPLLKSGLLRGDALVLTKPIGTGILFAALMRSKAKGRAIAAALDGMRRSNAEAAGILARHGSTAITDVTGFGLGGHLIEMLVASNATARIDMACVPLYPTVRALANDGISSTLLPENLRLSQSVAESADLDDADCAILFDPQTSGGLLAGVPANSLKGCLESFKSAGLAIAHIGEITGPADGNCLLTII